MSGWTIQLDPASIASDRTMLDLNSPTGALQVGASASGTLAIDWGTATITPYETQQGQYGNSVADFVLPNRTVTIGLCLGGNTQAVNEETARSQLQQKVGLLQREGGQIMRQRAGGPRMYADITWAELTIPDQWGETGEIEVDVQLVLTCLPDFYGDEIILDTIYCTGYCDAVLQQSGSQAVIQGDYPGRARVIINNAPVAQYGVLWGFRSRYYNASYPLSKAASGFTLDAGASLTTVAGSYGAQVVTYSPPTTATQPFTEFAGLGLVGTYQVWARCYAVGATLPPSIRLLWGQSNRYNVSVANPWASLPAGGAWWLMNLGQISVGRTPQAPGHTPNWHGFLEAQNSSAGGSISVDMLWLQPLDECAGRAYTTGVTDAVLPGPYPGEIRYDGAITYVSALSTYESMSFYIGDLARIPPSGMENRAVELFVKPSFGDLDNATRPDSRIDPFTVTVIYRPCWLSRP